MRSALVGTVRRALRPLLVGALVLLVAVATLIAPVTVGAAPPAHAADLSQFNAGDIISDATFFDTSTMTQAQIQQFLQSKETGCASGATCLKDYYDTTRSIGGDAMCGAYAGGGAERASAIIYKVAQACGINPRVLLVTLQKEQGLVTSTWPSSSNYAFAMGANCPDTTGCSGNSAGFFIQVYSGAWQLKRYANPPGTSNYFTWYAPGHTWNILYNPNTGCGRKAVYVANQATADLYYYTPYTPDQAALNAGYGTGDSCSSYGNRNFFNYFTDWFGSTHADPYSAIDAEYAAVGGAATLGAPTSGYLQTTGNGGGFARAYANGSIYYAAGYGAHAVMAGPILSYYFALNGSDGDLSWPVSDRQQITASGVTGWGQMFGGGSVYSSSLGTFSVREPIRSAYFAAAATPGTLGWPVGDATCAAGVCAQLFQGGQIDSTSSGVFAVAAPYAAPYATAGGVTGTWGAPMSGAVSMAGGSGQMFTAGSAYAMTGSAAVFVSGAVRDFYFAQGGAVGSLGYPVAAVQCSTSTDCQQQFTGGWIITDANGARAGVPAIDAAYAAAGGASTLGAAIGSYVRYPTYGAGGFAQMYAGGSIYFENGAAVAYVVRGTMLQQYFAGGGAAGSLGWPTSAAACTTPGCRQDFRGASIVTDPAGVFTVADPVRAAYDAGGGMAGPLGTPTSGTIAMSYNGSTGGGQAFTASSIYYLTGAPAYAVSGPVLNAYFAASGAAGRLGFPVGSQQCTGTTSCQQQFQGGWIVWSSASGARITVPAIDAAYQAQGGASGPLGAQIGDFLHYDVNGGGFATVYAGGSIYDKPANGAFVVSGAIRNAYYTTGGAAGIYGWPKAAATCGATTCSQVFDGGTITVTQ